MRNFAQGIGGNSRPARGPFVSMRAQPFWQTLGIEPTDSEAAVRAAYAAKLKLTNPEDDAEGFKRLRAAYEAALWDARWRAQRAQAPSTESDDPDDHFIDPEFDAIEVEAEAEAEADGE